MKKKSQARHTHQTAAGIEDAIAVGIDIQFAEERSDLPLIKSRVRALLEILRALRRGPHSYDMERQSGDKWKAPPPR